MSLISRVIENLRERRDKVLNGAINCIPSTLKRFRNVFPGVEQGKFYLISGASKSGKSQFTSHEFLYNPVIYAYRNPDKVRLKIFYFPLEETPEAVTLRFMSYLLYVLSNKTIRISPLDLKSTNENKILPEEVLNILESEKFAKILSFYEEHVIFCDDKNPYGIFSQLDKYAKNNGEIVYKDLQMRDSKTGEIYETKRVFDHYIPNDPNEYVMCIVDHVSLVSPEKSMSLREAIDSISDYMIQLRNRYNYIPVIVQQQSFETINLEAFKAKKIRPTLAGLADCKGTGKACNVMLGITNPHSFELPEYKNYDISKLQGNIRFVEMVLNRDGEANGLIPLYFDGSVNYFTEMPKPDDSESIEKIYSFLQCGRVNRKINCFRIKKFL